MHTTLLRSSAALAAALLVLGACSKGSRPAAKREAWRTQAEASCLRAGLVARSAYIRPAKPINGPRACGARRPFTVAAAGGGRVGLSPAATLACPMIPAIDSWLESGVQPAAEAIFGEPVTAIDVAASYGCRTRNNKRGAKMSEHAYANALDVSAFRLASGRTVSVLSGWRGGADEALFLRSVHKSACGRFKTVIGPDGDRYHRDHFHFVLARHGRNGDATHCDSSPRRPPLATLR